MTLSIIAIGFSLLAIFLHYRDDKAFDILCERLEKLEQYTDKWNSYGEILGYKQGNAIHYYGVEMVPPERKLTKWNALLDYLKIEWKEGKVEPHFEKKK